MQTATRTTRSTKPPRSTDLRNLSLDDIYDLAERLEGRPVPGTRMSEAEFEAWCGEDVRAEWVDGEVILMSPMNDQHSDLNLWLCTLVRMFIEEHELGVARFDFFVRFSGQRRRRAPDLLFLSEARAELLRPTYVDGAPDLVFEIISPDSQSRDRREKFEEYEKGGVREYWIIDPLSKTVEAYRLDRRKFRRLEPRGDAIESLVLPKFKMNPAWLWRKPLPKVADTMKQMRLKR